MKTKDIVLKVNPQFCRTLSDPTGRGHDKTFVNVRIGDLPLDLPMEVNPRAQNTKSRVAKQIREGLTENSTMFHINGRGIVMTALDTKMNTRTGELTLTMAGNNYGVIDGGHTYRVIRETVEPLLADAEAKGSDLLNAFVQLEIITGIKGPLISELARARNTSAQVHDESLANLEGTFDWLKDLFKDTPFANRIAYRENEDDEAKPIDIREVVAILTMFHQSFKETDNPPVMAYASKGRCLEMFRDDQEGYKMIAPIAAEALRLYDYVHLKFPDFYESIGGFASLGDGVKGKGVKLAKVGEVKHYEEGFDLDYLSAVAHYRFPDGWLYPVVAALRGLVKYGRTEAKWVTGPAEFFDRYGKGMVKLTLEAARQSGRSPNAVGKNRNHWTLLHERVENNLTKMNQP